MVPSVAATVTDPQVPHRARIAWSGRQPGWFFDAGIAGRRFGAARPGYRYVGPGLRLLRTGPVALGTLHLLPLEVPEGLEDTESARRERAQPSEPSPVSGARGPGAEPLVAWRRKSFVSPG